MLKACVGGQFVDTIRFAVRAVDLLQKNNVRIDTLQDVDERSVLQRFRLSHPFDVVGLYAWCRGYKCGEDKQTGDHSVLSFTNGSTAS